MLIFSCSFFVIKAQEKLKHFLTNNITTFNADTLDTKTLEILKYHLKNVEIIGLGEQTHFDGITSIVRVPLVKYLHQQCNFNVIAFESGFYDCYKVYELAKTAKNQDALLMQGIFGIWQVKEVKPLFEYIATTYKTAKPLKFAGFDHQFSGIVSQKYFIDDLRIFLEKENIFDKKPQDYDAFFEELKRVIRLSNYGKTHSEDTKKLINKYTQTIYQFLDKKKSKEFGDYFWMVICKNLETEIIHYEKGQENLRDKIMAKNLNELRNLYPNEKIILWAASSHLAYNQNFINYNLQDAGGIMMGEYVKKEYNEKYYFLGFTSYEGKYGKGVLNLKLKTPKKENSFEYNLTEMTSKNAFIPLNAADNNLKQMDFTSNLFGNTSLKMKLFSVADGMIYIRKMTKVHKIK